MDEEMVEDAVNEEEVEYTFTAYEIDLDYEFDAARFFDFERGESPLETSQAELWFDSAGSYPPSPFVAKLVPREEILMENVNISPKSKVVESTDMSEGDSDVAVDCENPVIGMIYGDGGQDKGTSSAVHTASRQKFQNQSQKLPSGLTFYNHMVNNANSENQTNLSKKPTFPRTSTLMKPTASHLAKQDRPFQSGYSRSHTSVFGKPSKSSANTGVIENQAAKRQKLEGGLLRKVMGTVQLQHPNFFHKVPKQEGFINGNPTHTKLRCTIPKDLDLVTAHRAERAKSSKDENKTTTVRRFKALPLNRKILEAPSLFPKRSTPRLPIFQEFHLKTSERAMQRSSAILKSTVPGDHFEEDSHKVRTNLTTDCGKRGPGRFMNNASKVDGCQSSQSFKALPLNQKKFNYHTEKRFPDNPPIELFNKLSLACESQVTTSESKAPRSISIFAKGSKENRWVSFQQANEIKQPANPRTVLLEGKLHFSNELKNEVSISSGFSWSKPMR